MGYSLLANKEQLSRGGCPNSSSGGVTLTTVGGAGRATTPQAFCFGSREPILVLGPGDTTYSPQEGPPQGTRQGNITPYIGFYLIFVYDYSYICNEYESFLCSIFHIIC